MRLLRALLGATVLLVLNSAAQAQTFTQVQWGVNRGATPSPMCVMSGATCLTNIGSFTSQNGFVPTGGFATLNAFVAAGETTVNSAIARAATYLTTLGGGTLRVPGQGSCYSLASSAVITASNITIQGDGSNASCVQANFDDDAISFGDGTANPEGVHINGVMFKSNIPIASRTKGAFVRFRNTYNSGASDIICRDGQYVCIDVDGGANQWTTRLKSIFTFTGHSGIRVGNAGGRAQETFIDNASIAGQTVAALELISAGGLYTSHISGISNAKGVLAHPGAGQQVSGWLATDDLWDTQSSIGVHLRSDGGIISQLDWNGVWTATCGQAVGPVAQDATAACIRIEGAANQVFGLRMKGLQVFNAATNGIVLAGGNDIHLEGRVTANSTVSHGTYDNVLISPNVSNFSVRGRIGGVLSSGIVGSPTQNFAPIGVHVSAGSSNFYTIDCDCGGNTVQGVSDEAAGANRYINDFSGTGAGSVQTGLWNHTGVDTFQQPPIFATLTGYLKGHGASALTAAATVPLSDLATQATNTIVGNATSGSAAPTALAIGSCSTASSALIWTTNTGFGCNTAIVPTFANPSASVGLAAVNGSATTAMRSDAAPALSQAIVPTWSGIHTFSAAPIFSLGAKYSGSSSGTVTVLAPAVAGTPTITWGNTSGTPAVTASAPLALSTTTGNMTVTGAAGQVLAGSTPAFTATPTLGVAGSAIGTLALAGNTSGTATITPQATAGSPTLTLPNASGTFAVSATSPVTLSATTGAVGCATCVTSSGGGAITGTAPVAVSAAGAVSITGAAGQVLAGASPAFTATPTLGVAGSTVGSLALANATSGSVTLQPVTGALGSAVLSLPATTSTIAALGLAQTWTAAQSFNSSDMKLNGATSGALTVNCAATCGSNTLTLPAGTTDFSSTGGTSQVLRQSSTGAAITVAQIASTDLSDSGAWTSTGAMTVACASGSGTLSASGAYKQIMSKTIAIRFTLTVTTASTCTFPQVTLPFTAAGNGVLAFRENTGSGTNAGKTGAAAITGASNLATFSMYDGSNPSVSNGEAFSVSGIFEAQ